MNDETKTNNAPLESITVGYDIKAVAESMIADIDVCVAERNIGRRNSAILKSLVINWVENMRQNGVTTIDFPEEMV